MKVTARCKHCGKQIYAGSTLYGVVWSLVDPSGTDRPRRCQKNPYGPHGPDPDTVEVEK